IGEAAEPAAREAAAERFDALLETRRRGLEGQAATLGQQAPVLKTAVAEAEERLDLRGADLIQLRPLRREADATRVLHEHFLARGKETSAQQGIQQADSGVLSWASPPKVPSSPDRSGIIGRAAVLSIALGIGLVFLLEHMNRRFRTPEELEEAIGQPVLAV